MSYKMIDISKHQATFLGKVAKHQGIDTVSCRIAYAGSKDVKFDSFSKEVVDAKLNFGVYGFLTAHYAEVCNSTFQTARKLMQSQVQTWLNIAKTAPKINSWFAVDEELERNYTMGLDKADNTALLNEACDMIAAAGYNPCVYCGALWCMQYVDVTKLKYPLWIAFYYNNAFGYDFDGIPDIGSINSQYADFIEALGNKCCAWQFGSVGRGPQYGCGVDNVDRDILYFKPNEKVEEIKMDYSFDTYKIGPVSSGDRKAMSAYADSLGIKCVDAGDCIVIGPMSGGDRKSVVAKAQGLLLGIEGVGAIVPPAEEVKKDEAPAVEPSRKDNTDNSIDTVIETLLAMISAGFEDGREKTLSQMKVEEAQMWLSKAKKK